MAKAVNGTLLLLLTRTLHPAADTKCKFFKAIMQQWQLSETQNMWIFHRTLRLCGDGKNI